MKPELIVDEIADAIRSYERRGPFDGWRPPTLADAIFNRLSNLDLLDESDEPDDQPSSSAAE